MPTAPTAQPGLLPVPGSSPDVPVLALDLGADAPALAALGMGREQLREAALDQLREQGLQKVPPGAYVPAPGAGRTWTADITRGHIHIASPSHVVYDGTLATWPAYARAVAANGWLLLYAGHLQIGWGTDAVQAVRTAASEGQVLGGIVPTRIAADAADIG